jgi:hypothetical protein
METLFSVKRLCKFTLVFREKNGKLPTLADLEHAGFTKKQVNEAVRTEWLEELYTNMTSGAVVKVYKARAK